MGRHDGARRRMKQIGMIETFAAFVLLAGPVAASGQRAVSTPDTVSVHLQDVDVRTAIQALSPYLDRPVVFSAIGNSKVTLETPKPISAAGVIPLLRATLESQNLELVSDSGGPYRVQQKAQRPPVPDPALARARAGGEQRLYVIRLSHARAVDVAATVNALYGRASAFGEIGGQPQTLSQQLSQTAQSSYSAITTAPQPNSGSALIARSATLTGETTIVPDASTNSLLVRANAGDYDLIAAAVKELDVRPLEALIEVVVAEVRRDRSLEFGIDIGLPATHLPGHPHTTYDGVQTGLPGGDASLHILGIGGDPDLEATIRAAASRGDVTIVSRPRVIAANNEEAQIMVGSQRPFVQVSRSLPTDGAARDQVVQYKDVGTKLSVRPTISSDGYVTLQVSQEVSAATTETQFDAPIISTRAVQTRLLMKDGQTVVIGGLTDRQHDVTQEGVPVLSSIPWVGGLFGRSARRTSETELYLFITPRVVHTDADADQLTRPLQERAKEAKP